MNEQINQSNLLNMAQTAKKLNVNYQTLVAAFKRGSIDGDHARNLVDLDSAREYFSDKGKVAFSDLELDFDEYLRPLDFISQNFVNQPQRLQTKINYLVSSKGQIFDATLNKLLNPSLATHGYLQVTLSGIEKIYMRVHTLVGLGFCPNRLGKTDLHHIDGNILNNNYLNLVWLWKSQHIKAHQLMKTDQKAYQKYIAEIKKENAWDGEYRPIIIEKANETFFAWIKKDVWQEYQNGLKTLDDIYYYDIGAERTIYKRRGEEI